MANKIQIRRGLKANLPILSNGELGLAIDTKELFIGSPEGNISIITDVESNPTLKNVFTQLNNKANRSTTPIDYYVNPNTGNDANDGLSAANPFKTMTKALSAVPEILNHGYTIYLADGDIHLKLTGLLPLAAKVGTHHL